MCSTFTGICGNALFRPDFVLLRDDRAELFRSKDLSIVVGDALGLRGNVMSPFESILSPLRWCWRMLPCLVHKIPFWFIKEFQYHYKYKIINYTLETHRRFDSFMSPRIVKKLVVLVWQEFNMIPKWIALVVSLIKVNLQGFSLTLV